MPRSSIVKPPTCELTFDDDNVQDPALESGRCDLFQKGMVEGYENFTSFGIKQMRIFVKSILVGIDTD